MPRDARTGCPPRQAQHPGLDIPDSIDDLKDVVLTRTDDGLPSMQQSGLTYYKVVSVIPPYLSDAPRYSMIFDPEDWACVTYHIGRVTRPNRTMDKLGYGLFVFDTLFDAKKMAGAKNEIWAVTVGGVYPELPRYFKHHDLRNGVLIPSRSRWPSGTVMVRWLILDYIICESSRRV